MKHFAVLILAILLSNSVGAQVENNTELERQAVKFGFQNSEEMKAYFTVDKVTVTENQRIISPEELMFTELALVSGTANDAGNFATSLGGVLTDLGFELGDVSNWITVGLKLWDLVKANEPVVNVKTQTVSVLPKSQPNWHEMESWKGPQAKSYTIAAKNLYGMTVVSHTYTIAFHYGGSLNGRGQFLANATILPTQVDVAWGFTLNSDVKVGEPLNSGTVKDPIPGVGLGLDWSMSSVLKKIQGRDQFYVRGDGTTSHVTEL